jgi:coproporphyrinogen III oxidase
MNRESISLAFKGLQDHICNALELTDGRSLFQEDLWDRAEGGGGRTRIIQDGAVIEKGGVAFSEVFGPVTEIMKKQLGLDGNSFFATGVSIVLHPFNPFVPIIHMNVRYFELDTGVFWFGGGIDLTPHYIFPSQAKSFHEALKMVCDQFDRDAYHKFKLWADDYFFIPHRDETRGVGGIFFDHLGADSGHTKEEIFEFCIALGKLFPIVYEEQVNLGKNKSFGEENLRWRNLRRGRYVEFNLVNDRGTKFGLLSGGRTESILMSLPKNANWEYNYQPETTSNEALTLSFLRKHIDWLNIEV